jgi:hypothetical protein
MAYLPPKAGPEIIDTGFLVNALTQKNTAHKAFARLLRQTVKPKGEDVVNAGAVMPCSATFQHPCGATIIIPARPFLHPVMEQYRKEILDNYLRALRATL